MAFLSSVSIGWRSYGGFVPAVEQRSRGFSAARTGVVVRGATGITMTVTATTEATTTFNSPQELRQCLASIVLFDDFRRTEEDSFATLLVQLLDALSDSKKIEAAEIYGRLWVRTCGVKGKGWFGEIIGLMWNNTKGNPFTEVALGHETISEHLRDAAAVDLRALQAVAFFDTQKLIEWIGMPQLTPFYQEVPSSEELPRKSVDLINELKANKDWGANVEQLFDVVRSVGVGITGDYYGLHYEHGHLRGVITRHEALSSPPMRFVGVEDIQLKLKRNTEFLVRGLKAQNALLYGPPGCGKSSMIRSLVSDFGEHGLRVIEVAKHELRLLPSLIAGLSKAPLAFIIFIDDLSYTEFEAEAMREGKAALEGSLRSNSNNVAIYTTSNRRHPAVNSIADETSEKMAFSQRFGLTLQFPDAGRAQFAKIVERLAQDAEIDMPIVELHRRSLLWAFGHHNPTDANGLSGRTARQFVDYLVADSELGDDQEELGGNVNWSQTPGVPWYAYFEGDEEMLQQEKPNSNAAAENGVGANAAVENGAVVNQAGAESGGDAPAAKKATASPRVIRQRLRRRRMTKPE